MNGVMLLQCIIWSTLTHTNVHLWTDNVSIYLFLHVHVPFVFQYGPNQYGLVVYGTMSPTSEPAVQYVKETRNAKQMLQFLDEVR